jgi:transcription antitermination factor NusG
LAHAYSPGLRVAKRTQVKKERRLPLRGEVLVKVGDKVAAETVVARTELPGNVQTVNVANKLSILPEDIDRHMLVKLGEWVDEGKHIAESKSFFGLFKSRCAMPVPGTIESVSEITGQVIVREKAVPVEVNAYVDGDVVEVYEDEGVLVKTDATFVQGIFGIGGEAIGELDAVAGSGEDVLTPDMLTSAHKDKIVLAGSLVTIDTLNRAREVGVRGLIAGGIGDADLRTILGYDLGVAITGSEEIGLSVVVTEGFGRMTMAERTFDLLTSRQGMKTSISGATQIRAGVIRPEVVIPLDGASAAAEGDSGGNPSTGLVVGSAVRAIREPYFGRIGKVTDLPPELQKLETEAMVRVLAVEFEDGSTAVIPRANVELIEE